MKFDDSIIAKRIREHGPPLHQAEIDRWASENGITLPDDYVKFLLRFNGGWFYEDCIVYESPALDSIGGSIGQLSFFGLEYYEVWNDLQHMCAMYGVGHPHCRIPANTLPIGSSSDGILLLSLRHGQILHWSRDLELLVGSPDENQIQIADSFAEFCAACHCDDQAAEDSAIESEEPFVSIELRRLQILKDHLDDGCPCELTNAEEQTLLYVACRELDFEGAEELLKRGANPDNGDHIRNKPPIWAAVSAGACDLTELLISYGASIYMGEARPLLVSEYVGFPLGKRMRSVLNRAEKGQS